MKPIGFRLKRVLLLALLVSAPLLLTACSEDEADLLFAMIRGWAYGVDILGDENSTPDLGEIALTALEQGWDSASNSPEAVALEGLNVMGQIAEADQIAEDAMADQSIDQIQKAIEIRPDDWTYQEDALVIALATSDGLNAQQALAASDRLIREAVDAGGDCQRLKSDQLRHRIEAIDVQLQITDPDSTAFRNLEVSRNGALEEMNTLGMENSFCNYSGDA